MRQRSGQSGYSLIEIIVVMLIVGLMSLVTVPQFISYQQSAKLKSALGSFNSDMRSARMLAISRYWQIRIEFVNAKTYKFYYRAFGTNASWNDLTQDEMRSARINGLIGNAKTLPDPLTFVQGAVTLNGTTYSAFNDLNSDSLKDVEFNADGSATLNSTGTQANGCVKIVSPWENVANNEMVVIVYISGKVASIATHS